MWLTTYVPDNVLTPLIARVSAGGHRAILRAFAAAP